MQLVKRSLASVKKEERKRKERGGKWVVYIDLRKEGLTPQQIILFSRSGTVVGVKSRWVEDLQKYHKWRRRRSMQSAIGRYTFPTPGTVIRRKSRHTIVLQKDLERRRQRPIESSNSKSEIRNRWESDDRGRKFRGRTASDQNISCSKIVIDPQLFVQEPCVVVSPKLLDLQSGCMFPTLSTEKEGVSASAHPDE